ncbi:COX5A [Lepeophtheirus salmonis]|uniref:Cytochrome c oxidase subunit 5A, mitochondrial n=1 Tax=Lepeophtheirus salmonis TaxID=72036 RepID=A0A817FB55_LEPSM|nr:COX5A [Lepeophtheirus salmonis]CAG9476930.1 COX5A [Lepeophtheirus salmonis]
MALVSSLSASTPGSIVDTGELIIDKALSISKSKIYDADLKTKVIAFFERPEIDGWEAQHGFYNLYVLDLVHELLINIAGFKTCKRLNDFGLIFDSFNHQNEVFHSRRDLFALRHAGN